jgi:predicted Rossmann-fold nucleotide-binding protein
MFNHDDAFIALPGGLGIMEEIFHIFSWAQLHIHHKPKGLLNVNDFYYNLLSFLDQAVEQEFLTFSARQIIIIALPGGLGTMEEIFHISSLAQLHIHHKPKRFVKC